MDILWSLGSMKCSPRWWKLNNSPTTSHLHRSCEAVSCLPWHLFQVGLFTILAWIDVSSLVSTDLYLALIILWVLWQRFFKGSPFTCSCPGMNFSVFLVVSVRPFSDGPLCNSLQDTVYWSSPCQLKCYAGLKTDGTECTLQGWNWRC
jgi:hypothetical protein